jgi:hypothetical protein
LSGGNSVVFGTAIIGPLRRAPPPGSRRSLLVAAKP